VDVEVVGSKPIRHPSRGGLHFVPCPPFYVKVG
jgi:hypothetical protein